MKIITWIHSQLTRCLRTLQWLLGASTVGVRTLVVNDRHEVLLVKHTYMPEWHFPGGGVHGGEPARIAALRELREETGVIGDEHIELFGIYFHKVMRVNDYIALYIVRQFQQITQKNSPEIAEVKWFSFDHLPTDLSNSTKRRIKEFFQHQPMIDRW